MTATDRARCAPLQPERDVRARLRQGSSPQGAKRRRRFERSRRARPGGRRPIFLRVDGSRSVRAVVGRDERGGKPRQGCTGDDDRANAREDGLPGPLGTTNALKAEHYMVACECRRPGEREGDQKPQGRRAGHDQHDVGKAERRSSSGTSHDDGAKRARATVVGEAAHGDADEQRQGEDCHLEHKGDQQAEAEQAEGDAEQPFVYLLANVSPPCRPVLRKVLPG